MLTNVILLEVGCVKAALTLRAHAIVLNLPAPVYRYEYELCSVIVLFQEF